MDKTDDYKRVLRMAGVPELLIQHPELVKSVPLTDEDTAWAVEQIRQHKATSPRFIDLKELRMLMHVRDTVDTTMRQKINSYPSLHCQVCGDTAPKHGYTPIYSHTAIFGKDASEFNLSSRSTSGLRCNKCSMTDEAYEKRFGEPKSADQ